MYACVCVCVCPSFSLTSTHLASPRLASPRPAPPPRSAGAAPFLFIGHTSLYVTHPFFNFIVLFIMKNKPGCCIRFIDHVPTLAIIRWVFLFDFNSSQRWTDQSGLNALLKLKLRPNVHGGTESGRMPAGFGGVNSGAGMWMMPNRSSLASRARCTRDGCTPATLQLIFLFNSILRSVCTFQTKIHLYPLSDSAIVAPPLHSDEKVFNAFGIERAR